MPADGSAPKAEIGVTVGTESIASSFAIRAADGRERVHSVSG